MRCAKVSSSRLVTRGATTASPAATVRIAATSSSGGAFLSRKPLAPARKPGEGVLVEIEGREDQDPDLGMLARDRLGGGDAVDVRHPHVHDHDVGPMPRGSGGGLPAVRRLRDHLEVAVRLEDHAEPQPEQVLVVGQDHPNRHRRPCRAPSARSGIQALTRQPPVVGPANSRPLCSATRSRIPIRPYPGVPDSGPALGAVVVDHHPQVLVPAAERRPAGGWRGGVFEGVGDAFLHEPEDGQLQAGGQPVGRAADPVGDLEAGTAGALEQRVEVGQVGLGGQPGVVSRPGATAAARTCHASRPAPPGRCRPRDGSPPAPVRDRDRPSGRRRRSARSSPTDCARRCRASPGRCGCALRSRRGR